MQKQNENNIDLLETLDNQEVHNELTEFVEQFSASSLESNIKYDAKMKMLTDIHSEVFGKPVPNEWNHNNMIDSKYTIIYNVNVYNNE